MEKQNESLREELLKLTWYMRGGLNYNEAMLLSGKEREIIAGIIKDNLETTKRSHLPFF